MPGSTNRCWQRNSNQTASDKPGAVHPWLYIVEHATAPKQCRLLRIQDPAGDARTYTFDKGWTDIAQSELL